MTGGDYYYYGAFGTEIIYTIFENTATTHTETPTTFNQHNLTSFVDGNRDGKTGNALPLTAVQITQQDDKKSTIENITGAVVEFNYDSTGDFADGDDVLILYLADKKYSTTDGNVGYGYVLDYSPSVDGTHDNPGYLRLSTQRLIFSAFILIIWQGLFGRYRRMIIGPTAMA